MLEALLAQNKIISRGPRVVPAYTRRVKKREAEKIVEKYKGKIRWEKEDIKGIANVPDDNRDYAMDALTSAGFDVSETGFSSGFWVEF